MSISSLTLHLQGALLSHTRGNEYRICVLADVDGALLVAPVILPVVAVGGARRSSSVSAFKFDWGFGSLKWEFAALEGEFGAFEGNSSAQSRIQTCSQFSILKSE